MVDDMASGSGISGIGVHRFVTNPDLTIVLHVTGPYSQNKLID